MTMPNGSGGLDPGAWLAHWVNQADLSALAHRTEAEVRAYFENLVQSDTGWGDASNTFFNVILGGFENLSQFVTLIVQAITGAPGGLTELQAFLTERWGDLADAFQAIADLIDAIAGEVGSSLADAVAKLATFLTELSPLDASKLFGLIGTNHLPLLSVAHIANINPELLVNAGFDSDVSVVDNPYWDWDGAVGRSTPLGSVKVVADGTIKDLLSGPDGVPVVEGQKLNVSAWFKYAGLVADAGSGSVRLSGTAYSADGEVVAYPDFGGIADGTSGSADWAQITGQYVVPAGVAQFRLRLSVRDNATGGTVWFDDCSVKKAGLLPQVLVDGLTQALGALGEFIQQVIDAILEALTGIPVVGGLIADVISELSDLLLTSQDAAAQASDALGNLADLADDLLNNTGAVVGNIGQTVVDTVGNTVNDFLDLLWGGLKKTPGTGKTVDDVKAAAESVATGVDAAQNSTIYLTSLLTLPRYTQRWLSSGPQDDASYPVVMINGTITPALGELVLIPVTAETTRTYKSVKFGMAGSTMTSLYVGVYAYVSGDLTLVADLGNVKSQLLGTKLQAFNMATELSVSRGQTLYIGVLQVGGTAVGMHSAPPGSGGMVEPAQEIPNWVCSKYGSGLTVLPGTFAATAATEQNAPAWGALGAEAGEPPPIIPAFYSDNFNRSDGTLTSPWTWVSGEAPVNNTLAIVGGRCTLATYGSSANAFHTYDLPFSTTNQRVAVDYQEGYSTATMYLRRKAGVKTMYVDFYRNLFGGKVFVTIGRNVGGTKWPMADNSFSISLPFRIEFSAVGNVYRAAIGSNVVEYTDTGGVFTYDETYNTTGLYMSASSGQSYFDNWEAADVV
ncbi:minor tail protein [Mycobacterium phage Bromden]|uniref:Minor tail protein n=1 Tax=Mycobacterium phage Bromden TaxID=2283252 RepID=A0A345MBF6_9CAUD|nr:minor tail protein [Mycobacterium phage Bromden]AXH67827.1 minor tail protein [Mycobacterium phage Bromden]